MRHSINVSYFLFFVLMFSNLTSNDKIYNCISYRCGRTPNTGLYLSIFDWGVRFWSPEIEAIEVKYSSQGGVLGM